MFSIIFLTLSIIILKNNITVRNQNFYTLDVLSQKKSLIENRLSVINKAVKNIAEDNGKIEKKLHSKNLLIKNINQMGETSITDMLNRMEIVIKKNSLNVTGFSLKDGEIYLTVILSDSKDTVKLIHEFEKEFISIMIMEHNDQTILLKLGDESV